MSAVFADSYLRSLTATLAAAPTQAQNKLIVGWVKWDSSYSHNSSNWAAQLAMEPGNQTNHFLRVGTNNSGGTQHVGRYVTSHSLATISGALDDVWTLEATYLPGNDGITAVTAWGYRTGTPVGGATTTAADASTDPFVALTIGQGGDFGGFSHWKGKIAEVSIWTPTDMTQANAIIAELLVKPADQVSEASPIWYRSLLADTSGGTGAALTNNGGVTFDALDHPTFAAAETISLLPPAASITSSGSQLFTIERSAVAPSGGVTYNLSSSTPAVATVPATVLLPQGQDEVQFSATAVAPGSTTISATNAADPSETDSSSLTVTSAPTAPTIVTTSLPDGAVGTPYNQPITVTGTPAPTASVVAGAMPAWATLNSAVQPWTITGDPTPGSWTFTLRATNSEGSDDQAFTLNVPNPGGGGGELPEVTTVTLVPGSASVSVSGTTDLTLTVEDQDGDPISGITGIASTTAAGVATATQLAPTDALGRATIRVTGVAAGSASISIEVDGIGSNASAITVTGAAVSPTITSPSPLPPAQVGVPYSYQFVATGTGPITWAGAPAGFSMSESGLLTGTASSAGPLSFMVTAVNEGGSDSREFMVGVSPAESDAPVFADVELPAGVQRAFYAATIYVSGAVPMEIEIVAGTLPEGVTAAADLDSRDRSLTIAGWLAGDAVTSTFTVRAVNAAGAQEKVFAIAVRPLGLTGGGAGTVQATARGRGTRLAAALKTGAMRSE